MKNKSLITVDRNGNPVTEPSSYANFCINFVQYTTLEKNRCSESLRRGGEEAARMGKPYVYNCHAGLIDFVAPILVDEKQRTILDE